ncbi:sugar transferase [Aurantibacillus circumpalustris]|uniref:sugar transferase n=1 Tax=Aurantibacillus circumpalustris TaxID=3036359 RepID=UPI00295A8A67|nr:sugar transferase [Aurantibacillus circumpalustris]
MLKRLFDIIFSALGLIILLPFMLLIAVFIGLTSKGGVFYRQERVGKLGKKFKLYKFRTMKSDSDKLGLLTVGGRDQRITSIGYYLRKYKLDEFPQLLNVLFGTMSIVGPRPEVRKYVDLYTDDQKKVLNVKPGITDYASLEYFSENDLLAKSSNPEETYIKEILPAKLALNKKYISEAGLITDIKVILRTLAKIVS